MVNYERGMKIVEKINRLKVAKVLPDCDLGFMFRSMTKSLTGKFTMGRYFNRNEESYASVILWPDGSEYARYTSLDFGGADADLMFLNGEWDDSK